MDTGPIQDTAGRQGHEIQTPQGGADRREKVIIATNGYSSENVCQV